MDTKHMTDDWVDDGQYCAQDIINMRDHIRLLEADLAASRERERVMREAIGKLDAIYRAEQDDPGIRPKWLRDALALSATGAVEGDGWLPIETAPKGQKIIAGYYNVLGKWRSVMACYYLPGTLPATDDWIADGEYAPEGWYEESETQETILQMDAQPTHWQPLPKAPTSKQEGEV